jgi:hypothetical protein
MQNIRQYRLPFGIPCDDVRLGNGHRRPGVNVTSLILSCIQPSAIRALSLSLDSSFSVKWGIECDNAGDPFFTSALKSSTYSSFLRRQSLLNWPEFPHCQHSGRSFLQSSAGGGGVPVRAPITSCCLTGGPAVTFAASIFRAWLRS